MRHDPWEHLRQFTTARIALGRAGGSLPTRELLDFQLAHARARDAVLTEFDPRAIERDLAAVGVKGIVVRSSAPDRLTYLQRPDLGRRLDESGKAAVVALRAAGSPPQLSIVISDGLSSLAVQRNATELLGELIPLLKDDGWALAPVVIVEHGRVAVQDEIGELVQAELSLVLIGERPGLGSPDSLGAYLVYQPRMGKTDADRNCVSNIRADGLTPAAAAKTLHYLLTEARSRKLSGVALKDERAALPASTNGRLPDGR